MSRRRRAQAIVVVDGVITNQVSARGRHELEQLVRAHLLGEGRAAALFGPVNPTRELDDPLVLWDRDSGIESAAEAFIASLSSPVLSVEDAQAWLAVTQLIRTAIVSASGIAYGVPDDGGRVELAEAELLNALGSLQVELIWAIEDVAG